MTVATYGPQFATYPVWTAEDGLSFEGEVKRFRSMPTPEDVFRFALLGLPKKLILTGETIISEDFAPFLENAITEIEMSTSMDISPVDHFQSFDYIDGMFEANFFGMRLERWPATHVDRVQLKYPHTQSISVPAGAPAPSPVPGQSFAYQTYTIPPAWIYLQRNTMNVVAAFGSVTVTTDQSAIANAGGIFSYVTGFGRGAYQPGMIEVWYTAGFPQDKLPNSVHDLIVTLAALRFLEAIAPAMMPYSSVNVQIDGVSQSAALMIAQLIQQRIAGLKAQYDKKLAAIRSNFGNNIRLAFIGA